MTAEDLLKLYREGQRDFSGADLSEISFDGEDLSDINLAGADLRGTKLCENNLTNANFQNADLRGVKISAECRGHNINFSGANFEATGMYEGIIEKANFSRANFRNASFAQFLMTGCNFNSADFSNAWISETDFSGGSFIGANFHKAHVDVNFFDATIIEADFSYSFFPCSPKRLVETRGINVAGANFSNAVFFVPRFKSPDDLDVSSMQGAICVSTQSDMDKLDLSKYNNFSVEYMSDHFGLSS